MTKKSFKLIVLSLIFALILGVVGNVAFNAQQEKEVYKVGVDAAFPPWTWVEKGQYKGFDVEVIRGIAEVENLEIEIIDMPWETIISALGAGKIDILVSGLSITCERDKTIDYSAPYWKVDQTILVREDSELNAITAMSMGHTVAAQRGTTGYMWVEDHLVKAGVDLKLKAYENYLQAVKDLEIGRIASVLCDTTTARQFVKKGHKIKIVGSVSTGEQYAYAVTEGDPYGLLSKINDGMKKLFESGRWLEIFNKYLAEYGYTPPAKVPMKRTLVCEEE